MRYAQICSCSCFSVRNFFKSPYSSVYNDQAAYYLWQLLLSCQCKEASRRLTPINFFKRPCLRYNYQAVSYLLFSYCHAGLDPASDDCRYNTFSIILIVPVFYLFLLNRRSQKGADPNAPLDFPGPRTSTTPPLLHLSPTSRHIG
jgi:hypothetical protein